MKTSDEFLEELKQYAKKGIFDKPYASYTLPEVAAYHDIWNKIEKFQEQQKQVTDENRT